MSSFFALKGFFSSDMWFILFLKVTFHRNQFCILAYDSLNRAIITRSHGDLMVSSFIEISSFTLGLCLVAVSWFAWVLLVGRLVGWLVGSLNSGSNWPAS